MSNLWPDYVVTALCGFVAGIGAFGISWLITQMLHKDDGLHQ